MGTTLITSKRNGYDPSKLTDQQRIFVLELLGSSQFNPTEAAKRAGYKFPPQAAYKLLKVKGIQAALGKAQRQREERCELKADDVLNYLKAALFFNPLHYFRPTDDGKWLIDDLSVIPEEIGRLIENMELQVTEKDGEVTSRYKVSFVSKATALSLALKHVCIDKQEIDVRHSWADELYPPKPDLVEARIEEERNNGKDE